MNRRARAFTKESLWFSLDLPPSNESGRKENTRFAIQARGNRQLSEKSEALCKQGQDLLSKFDTVRRSQRRTNQRIAKVKMACESILAGQWLSSALGSLDEAFATEPAAFVFRSTVPLLEPCLEKRASAPPHKPSPEPKQQEDGALRSLFRWLFGC